MLLWFLKTCKYSYKTEQFVTVTVIYKMTGAGMNMLCISLLYITNAISNQ